MTERELRIELPDRRAAVVFRRFADAPPSLVFDAWTQPEHLRRWWGPRDHVLTVCEADLRVGGGYRLVQRAPDGRLHGFSGRYLELDRPHRLSRTFVYDDAPGDEAVETVTFGREGDGTLISSESLFASLAARELYTRAGMEHGLRDAQHRLDEWLHRTQPRPDRSHRGTAG